MKVEWNGFAQDTAVQVGVTCVALFALCNLHALKMEKKNQWSSTGTSSGPLVMARSKRWKGRLENQKAGSCCWPNYSQHLPFKFPAWPGTESTGGCDGGKLESPGLQPPAHSQPYQAQLTPRGSDRNMIYPQNSKWCPWSWLCCSSLARLNSQMQLQTYRLWLWWVLPGHSRVLTAQNSF